MLKALGPAGQEEDRDFPRRLAQRPHRRALPVRRPNNGERFHAYVEQFLVRTLRPGDVVILDNLGSDQGKAARRTIPNVGARLAFLPKYSPTSIRSSRSSPSSRPCCERRESEATKRSPTRAAKSSPSTRPPNAPHTSRTQDTHRPKAGRSSCRFNGASGRCNAKRNPDLNVSALVIASHRVPKDAHLPAGYRDKAIQDHRVAETPLDRLVALTRSS
jgi:hypothetical protein